MNFQQIVSLLVICGLSVAQSDLNDEDYANVVCNFQLGGTQFCDCGFSKNLMKLQNLHGNVVQVVVQNCNHVWIPDNSLQNLDFLGGFRIENVAELQIDENTFNSMRGRPSIKMEFIKTNLTNLPSHFFKGNLREIIFQDCIIEKIHSFALTGLSGSVDTIKINNTQINEIETQAFKKLTIRNLEIFNSVFQVNSASNTFYDCNVENLLIEKSFFSMLKSSTFQIRDVETIRIINNKFGILEGEAFIMDISDRAVFNNNTITMMHFGAFQGITMNKNVPRHRTENVYFEFNNNQIDFVYPEEDINLCSDLKFRMNKLYLRDPKNCETVNKFYDKKFFNDHSNIIFMRTQEKDEHFNTISYLNERCMESDNFWMILLIILAVVVLLLCLIPFIYCYFCRTKQELDIVMPEPRTYRQTQIVMQVETHGLIKTDF